MNIKQLAENYGLAPEEVLGILEVFMDTTRNDLEKINQALGRQDAGAASDAAHSIKGAAGNLGFSEMSETAKTVEYNAKDGRLDEVTTGFSTLKQQLSQIEAEIKELS